MAASNIVHGESITDGDASGGIAVTLYESGSVVVRAVATNEFLNITDVIIVCEDGGNVYLCADGKVAGEYVFAANLAVNGGITHHFKTPFRCARGTTLVFYGVGADLDTCFVQGFIDT